MSFLVNITGFFFKENIIQTIYICGQLVIRLKRLANKRSVLDDAIQRHTRIMCIPLTICTICNNLYLITGVIIIVNVNNNNKNNVIIIKTCNNIMLIWVVHKHCRMAVVI